MKFKMNNHTWEIIDVTRQEIKDIYKKETNEDAFYLYGLSMIGEQIIYLNKDIKPEKKRKTLMHELMHCYKAEYISLSIDNIDEELLCDLCANSHDIIHEIVERYFHGAE